jgi:hypothetical protein
MADTLLKLQGFWAREETTPGVFEVGEIAAGDALKALADAALPTRQPRTGAMARDRAHPRWDHGEDVEEVEAYYQCPVSPLLCAYGLADGVIDGDIPPREAPWLKAAGYQETIAGGATPAGSVTYRSSGAPNHYATALSLRYETGPGLDPSTGHMVTTGMRYDVRGSRGRLVWEWGSDLPLRVTPTEWIGGFVEPAEFAVDAMTAQTPGNPPLVTRPLSIQIVETDVADASISNVYSSSDSVLSVPVAGTIQSAFPAVAEPEFTAYGYRCPPRFAPGRPQLQLTLMARPESVFPLRALVRRARTRRLRIVLIWDDATQGLAVGGVHRQVLRGCRIREAPPAQGSGTAMTQQLTLEAGCTDDSTLPAHEVATANVLASLPALADDPS